MFQKSCSGKKHTSYYIKIYLKTPTALKETLIPSLLLECLMVTGKHMFGVSFAIEETNLLNQNLLYFLGLRSYLSCLIFLNSNVHTKKFSSRFLCYYTSKCWKLNKKPIVDIEI